MQGRYNDGQRRRCPPTRAERIDDYAGGNHRGNGNNGNRGNGNNGNGGGRGNHDRLFEASNRADWHHRPRRDNARYGGRGGGSGGCGGGGRHRQHPQQQPQQQPLDVAERNQRERAPSAVGRSSFDPAFNYNESSLAWASTAATNQPAARRRGRGGGGGRQQQRQHQQQQQPGPTKGNGNPGNPIKPVGSWRGENRATNNSSIVLGQPPKLKRNNNSKSLFSVESDDEEDVGHPMMKSMSEKIPRKRDRHSSGNSTVGSDGDGEGASKEHAIAVGDGEDDDDDDNNGGGVRTRQQKKAKRRTSRSSSFSGSGDSSSSSSSSSSGGSDKKMPANAPESASSAASGGGRSRSRRTDTPGTGVSGRSSSSATTAGAVTGPPPGRGSSHHGLCASASDTDDEVEVVKTRKGAAAAAKAAEARSVTSVLGQRKTVPPVSANRDKISSSQKEANRKMIRESDSSVDDDEEAKAVDNDSDVEVLAQKSGGSVQDFVSAAGHAVYTAAKGIFSNLSPGIGLTKQNNRKRRTPNIDTAIHPRASRKRNDSKATEETFWEKSPRKRRKKTDTQRPAGTSATDAF